MAGLSSTGFSIKRLPDIKSELEGDLSNALGQMNFSPETVTGQLVGIESDARATIWEMIDHVYHSQYPNSANGINLDRCASINGVTRLGALTTTVTARVSGIPGTLIPEGSLAKNPVSNTFFNALNRLMLNTSDCVGLRFSVNAVEANSLYQINIGQLTLQTVSGTEPTANEILTALLSEITADYRASLADNLASIEYDQPTQVSVSENLTITQVTCLLDFASVETGEIVLPANAMNTIETPIVGWESVINPTAGQTGREIETDEQLRLRRAKSVMKNATNTLLAIQANLLQMDGVTHATVRQNNTPYVDEDGMPPQHVWAIVQGGLSSDIAQLLFSHVAAGVGYFGDQEEIIVSDITTQEYIIRYSRPVIIPVYVRVVLHAPAGTALAGYLRDIRQKLVAFGDNFFNIGTQVRYSRFYFPV
jgi:uncharacterized phage protein gp47/JayE